MQASEFLNIINENDLQEDWREESRELCGSYHGQLYSDSKIVEKLNELGYELKSVDGYGGEGKGDDYWGVFSITDSSDEVSYFQISGWYASYSGSEVDPFDIVKVTKKQVVKYEWRAE